MGKVGETAINDIELYNSRMAKSLIDKIFFMDKLDDDIKFIIDYGCADGALIGFLAPLFPDIMFFGFDLDEQMVACAQKNYGYLSNVMITDKMSDIFDYNNFNASCAALNMSSLIHEVYSYSADEAIEEFWNDINSAGFKYIITRDMCLDNSAHRSALKEDVVKIKSHYDVDKIAEFEHYHGSINDNYNMIHFLLKYRYKENWNREVKENYLPLTVEEIATKVDSKYNLIYMDHYILPYIARTVEEDFGIVLKDYTHAKFIYKLK